MVEPLDIDDVEVRGGPLVLASDAEVDEMQEHLGVAFPDGYRDYVMRLGEGLLTGFVRVLPPWRILAEVEEHRGMMSAFWFWQSGNVPFAQEQAMESIQVADTIEGDVVAFHPANRRQIIVLPRGGDRLHARGPDFLETINWVCSLIGEVGPRHYFEPLDSRLESDMTPALMPVAPDRGATAPALGQLPREVLMSYFAELRAVEEWAIAKAGGPAAFQSDWPPDLDDDDDELIARSDEIHARYCTHRLASALSGASVTLSATPKHDPSAIRVVEERQVSPDRVVIQTAEGTDFVYARQYVLERAADEWRISSRTDLVHEDSKA